MVVVLLLLPTLCGGLIRGVAEQVFDEKFRGTLEVRELELAWRSPQKITDAVLRDPEKNEVARVTAVLPSILDLIGGKGTLHLHVDVDADLVADDHGAVNLQRAIEPRTPETPRAGKKAEEPGSDPLGMLSRLDAEVDIASRHLSWSDADTRKAGKPFQVLNLNAKVRVKPGQPLTVHTSGQVVSDTPGALEIDATLRGPIESGKAWPFGDVDAKVRVEGFPTAMVDGIGGLGGKLTEVLGPRFDLRLTAVGVNPQKGGVEIGLSSPRSSFDFAGNFEGGLLRSKDGSPVHLSLGVPRGFVADMMAPKLPAGVKIAWEESEKPWTVSITDLELPIPDAGALDMKGLAKTFEHLRCGVDVDLPAYVAVESEETRAAGVHAAVEGMRASLSVAPGEPMKVRVEMSLDTGSKGQFDATATIPDPWKSLTTGAIPPLEASVHIQALSTRAIDALAGQGGRLADAIGASLALTLEARTVDADHGSVSATVDCPRVKLTLRGAADSETILRCTGDQGLDFSWDPPAGWIDRQLVPFLPPGSHLTTRPGKVELRAREIVVPVAVTDVAQLSKILAVDLVCRLPGATWSSEGGSAGLPPVSLDPIELETKLAPGGDLTLTLRTAIDGGSGGRLSVDVTGHDLLHMLDPLHAGKDANGKGPLLDAKPWLDAKIGAEGIATAKLDLFAGKPGLLSGALGPTLSLSISGRSEGRAISGKIEASSSTTSLRASARLDGNQIVAAGEDGLHLALNPTERWFAETLAPYLPPGTTIALTDSNRPIEIDVRDLALTLPPAGPGTPGASAPAASSAMLEGLEGLACKLGVRVGGLRYSDGQTKALKSGMALRDLDLTVEVAPKKALLAKLSVQVDAGQQMEGGKLAANVSLPDPWFFLRADAPKIPPVDADIRLPSLPTASLDTLCGRAGLLSGLFGATADLAVGAHLASADAGSFTAAFTSSSASVSATAKLEKGMIVSADKPALDVALTLTQAWLDQQVGPLLPAGSHLSLPDGPDAKRALHLAVGELRLPLPQGALTADAFSAISMQLSASVPNLAYSDAKTAAAGTPALVRDLGFEVHVSPGKAPEAKLSAKIDGNPPGEIAASVRALDPMANLAGEKGLEHFHVAADASAKSLPTGLLDALAGQGGMLVDVLGPRLDFALHSDSISQADGTFTASMESDKASVRCDRGGMKDGILYLEKVQGKNEALLARAGLTPLFSERIIGSLVPALVNMEKPQGSDPVALSVDELRMPLGADLSKLDALVRLNLGEVSYRLLPGLTGMLGKGDATTVKMPEIKVPIQKGVASYDGLPIRIGGRDCLFKGTFNLVDKSFKLDTQLPLSVLGKNVNGKLDGLRGILDPNTMVPLELRGTWKSPKLGVGDEFLKKVAEDALKKQGGNLLDGLLKKKKN
jgi:hypothetical protein